MVDRVYPGRLKRCSQLMKEPGSMSSLLTKPSNMFYLTGDGRLCAYAMITQEGKVATGVPQTDLRDTGTWREIAASRYPRVTASRYYVVFQYEACRQEESNAQ